MGRVFGRWRRLVAPEIEQADIPFVVRPRPRKEQVGEAVELQIGCRARGEHRIQPICRLSRPRFEWRPHTVQIDDGQVSQPHLFTHESWLGANRDLRVRIKVEPPQLRRQDKACIV